jgi:hypothetical protein
MNENTHGAEPNDGESTPENPAQDHNNNGSEPAEIQPAADENNNNPAKAKKPRRTDAELLADLKQKLGAVVAKQRQVKDRLEKKRDKELVKLKLVIGEASLVYLKSVWNTDQAKRLVDMVRRCAIDRDKSWLTEHFARLLKEHAAPKPRQDVANGDSPSPS